MDEARLDRGLGEHRGDRVGEARQHVDHREQDGADSDIPVLRGPYCNGAFMQIWLV